MKQELLKTFIEENDILEPETLRQVFPEISEEELNKVMAMKLLKHTRHFWENFYAFENIVLALNDVVPDFEKIDGCTPEQIWYAVQLADQIRPGMGYAKEVQIYVKFMCNDSGVFIYPPSIGLDNPYYEKAKEISEQGPFPIGEETTEEIQAGKLLAIKEYLNEKMHQM
jgi:hypothetical protein